MAEENGQQEQGYQVDATQVIEKIRAMQGGQMMVDLAVSQLINEQQQQIIQQLASQQSVEDRAAKAKPRKKTPAKGKG